MSPRNPFTVKKSTRPEPASVISAYQVWFNGSVVGSCKQIANAKTTPTSKAWTYDVTIEGRGQLVSDEHETRAKALEALWKHANNEPTKTTTVTVNRSKARTQVSEAPTQSRSADRSKVTKEPRSGGVARPRGGSTSPATRATSSPVATAGPDAPACQWCDRLLPPRKPGAGRPRAYCGEACRQKAKRARLELRPEAMQQEILTMVAAVEVLGERVKACPSPRAAWAAETISRCAAKLGDVAAMLTPAELDF